LATDEIFSSCLSAFKSKPRSLPPASAALPPARLTVSRSCSAAAASERSRAMPSASLSKDVVAIACI